MKDKMQMLPSQQRYCLRLPSALEMKVATILRTVTTARFVRKSKLLSSSNKGRSDKQHCSFASTPHISSMPTDPSNEQKELWIMRHGQAEHNVRAEPAHAAGCSFEEFLELMRRDDSLDSPLTALGREQATTVYKDNHSWRHIHAPNIELVVSSPLSRAIETADLVLPPADRPCHRICYEYFREINGSYLNAKRRPVADLTRIFPHWDFGELETQEDMWWTPSLEAFEACGERCFVGLNWLLQRPEQTMLLVGHGAILRRTMQEHPHVRVADERKPKQDQRPADARMFNCELRRYRIEWDEKVVEQNSTGEIGMSLGDKDVNKRKIVLTELDIDHVHETMVAGEEDTAFTVTA